MKLNLLHLIILLCGLIRTAVGQQSIQFIYIGPENGDHDSVLITTANPYGERSKSLRDRLTKVSGIKSVKDAAESVGVARSGISSVLNGRWQTAGGSIWRKGKGERRINLGGG
jgi:hypothetical protein